MKNNYFIILMLLFCTYAFCAENNTSRKVKSKNILYALLQREIHGTPFKAYAMSHAIRRETKEGQDLLSKVGYSAEDYSTWKLIQHCCASDENSADVPFLMDELLNDKKKNDLEYLRSLGAQIIMYKIN